MTKHLTPLSPQEPMWQDIERNTTPLPGKPWTEGLAEAIQPYVVRHVSAPLGDKVNIPLEDQMQKMQL